MASTPLNDRLPIVLRGTLSSDRSIRVQATESLHQCTQVPGCASALLQIAAGHHGVLIPNDVRQAAAIALKNLCQKEWINDPNTINDFNAEQQTQQLSTIGNEERDQMRNMLIACMMAAPPREIQVQLALTLQIIAAEDYPEKWNTLMPQLAAHSHALQEAKPEPEQQKQLANILETVAAIFHRYRFEKKSEALWREVKYSLDHFQEPLFAMFQRTLQNVTTYAGDAVRLPPIFASLQQLLEIFLSLSSQDIPEYFEDHLDDWFKPLEALLKFHSPLLASKNDEPGVLETTHCVVCEIVNLYTLKYEDVFKDYVPLFVNDIWTLLTGLSDLSRYDQLVTTAIKFLTNVIRKEWYKSLFANETALKTLCERVIIPQIRLRETDIELFSMDPIEYVRRDMEGSDVDTRRRTTVDFVRGVCVHFECEITTILNSYIKTLLQEYAVDSAKNWVAKDAALYIVLALAAKARTQAKGVTQLNPYIDISGFFASHVLPELGAADVGDLPILKADCLKFVNTFRYQLPADSYPVLLPLLIKHLRSDEYVVHTYAAACIERLLSTKDDKNMPRVSKEALQPFLHNLLGALFAVLNLEESKENEYVMRAIMRVCSIGQETMASFGSEIISQVTQKLSYVAQNPRNPSFNHYLFETIAALVLYICKADQKALDGFEKSLFVPFQAMLSMEFAAEFHSYVFQILAEMLEMHVEIPPAFLGIFPNLLMPALYENTGNIPALARLLHAYLQKGATHPVIVERYAATLGVFAKLNSKRSTEQYGLEVADAFMQFVPLSSSQQFLPGILRYLFPKLQSKPSPVFIRSVIVLLAKFVHQHKLAPLLEAMNAVQPGIFDSLYSKIWLPNMTSLYDVQQKRAALVGTADILSSPECLNGPFSTNWIPSVQSALILLAGTALNSDETVEKQDFLDASDQGFSTAYARLVFSSHHEFVNVPDVPDTGRYLAQRITAAIQAVPHMRTQLTTLDSKVQQHLQELLTATGTQL